MKTMQKILRSNTIALLFPVIFLGSCTSAGLEESLGNTVATLQKQPSAINLLMARPIESYTVIARLVHKCWLNNRNPLLANHVFFASATRKGGEKAHIGIHQRAKLGRKGASSFAISFTPAGAGTSVTPMNYRFSDELAEKLKLDLTRWKSGDMSCQPYIAAKAEASSDLIPAPKTAKLAKKSPNKSKIKK